MNHVDNAYFQQYTGRSRSFVDALDSLSIDSSYDYRKKIAAVNHIQCVVGSAKWNTTMLDLLKQGKLRKVA